MIKETWLLLALLMPPEATEPRREHVIGSIVVKTKEACSGLAKAMLDDWKATVADTTPLKLKIMCIPRQRPSTDTHT